jgi:hypothetical protein
MHIASAGEPAPVPVNDPGRDASNTVEASGINNPDDPAKSMGLDTPTGLPGSSGGGNEPEVSATTSFLHDAHHT